eukprot:425854_1
MSSKPKSYSSKKELMKLSKPKLIKLCKKKKLAVNGSKSQMIDRILSLKNKSKRKSQKKRIIDHTAAKTNIFSNERKKIILIYGYINNQYKNKHYPQSLMVIILGFIGTICLKFDICPKTYIEDILKNGTIIKRDVHKIKFPITLHGGSFSISKGLKIVYGSTLPFYAQSIHKWSIKIKNSKRYSRIGIVSNIDLCTNICSIQDIGCDAYYIYPNHRSYVICSKLLSADIVRAKYHGIVQVYESQKYKNGSPSISDFGVTEKRIKDELLENGWHKNDIITCIMDSNQWTLQFIVNDKKIGKPINIENKCPYYAAIGTVTDSTKFILV